MHSAPRARGAALSLALAVLLAAGPGFGQEPPGEEPSGTSEEATGATAGPAEDPAWQLYDRAFEALAAGDADSARALLTRLRGEFPGHPASDRAASRLAELDGPAAPPPGATEPASTARPGDRPGHESPSQQARAELALTMTVHGILLGADICEMVECEGSSRAWAATLMASGGAALGLSLYLTRDGIRQGRAQLLDSAMTWGSWNSLLLTDGLAEGPTEAGYQVASQAGGLALGMGLWHVWRPTSGQVALANTGGVWTVVLTLLAHGMAEESPSLDTIVLAGDAGLLLGGLVSNEIAHISRGRTLLIDTGGVLGFLTGGLAAVIADPREEGSAFTYMFVGTAAGLGLSTYVTRDWDVPEVGSMRMAASPMGRRGWGATLSLDWP